MVISTASSSTSASRLKRRNQSSLVLVSALVSVVYGDVVRLHLTIPQAYTISRAILSDAIALTRGDRFFTIDYTPFNLTSWGFADAQRDPDGPGNGSMLGRLLLRTLPHEYTSNSTYTWFPLMTPGAMEKILTNLEWKHLYDLQRPTTVPELKVLTSYDDVKTVMKEGTTFGTGFMDRVKRIVDGPG